MRKPARSVFKMQCKGKMHWLSKKSREGEGVKGTGGINVDTAWCGMLVFPAAVVCSEGGKAIETLDSQCIALQSNHHIHCVTRW